MAKNVNERKKRIAHNKSAFSDGLLEGENVTPGCMDYVTSIIQDMDHNFSSIHSNKRKASQSNLQSQFINIEKNTAPSSNPNLHNTNFKSRGLGLNRKFPLMEKTQKTLKQIKHNRKIPKQRAHLASLGSSPVYGEKKTKNRLDIGNLKRNSKNSEKFVHKIASSVNREPNLAASKKSKENSEAPCEKIELHNVKRKSKSERSFSSVDSLDNIANDVHDSSNGNSTDSEYEKFISQNKNIKKKKLKTSVSRKKIPKNSRKVKNTASGKILKFPLSDHDSDLGDAVASSSSYSHCRKSFPPSDHDSDLGDAVASSSSSSYSYRRKSKRVNTSNNKDLHGFTVCSDAESVNASDKDHGFTDCSDAESVTDMYDGDIFTRDSSSENDVEDNETQFNEKADNDGDVFTRDSSSENVEDNETQIIEKADNEAEFSEKADEYNVLPETHSLSNRNNAFDTSISNELSIVYSENNSSNICSTVKNDSISVNSVKQNNPPSETIIVELSSDDECENVISHVIPPGTLSKKQDCTLNMNKNESRVSEESDIEVVDVIVHESLERNVGYNKVDDIPHSSNEFCIKTEKVSTPVSIEIEKFQNKLVEPKIELERQKKDADDEYQATYITDICKKAEETDCNISILNQPQPDNVFPSSVSNISEHSFSKDILDDRTVPIKKMKKEVSEDDDIIILDSVESTNCQVKKDSVGYSQINSSRPNLQINENKSIKNEKRIEKLSCLKKERSISCNDPILVSENNTLTEKEIKLFEVACSDVKAQIEYKSSNTSLNIPPARQSGVNDINHEDAKSLLQTLKSEFLAYQEIIQTKATVGATFNLLENRQAEKLTALRSAINTCLKSSVYSDSTNLEKEVNLMLSQKTLTNKLEVSSMCSDEADSNIVKSTISSNIVGTSKILPEGFQNQFSSTSSLSSSMERDVKPNLTELHNVCQPVTKTSNITPGKNVMTFGEKCIVCGKEAMAACQQCAKVFFCSNECGLKYWINGHETQCGK